MKPRTFLAAFLLCSAAVAQVRDPLPVPDIPGYKTLKGDFHIHTVFSDGQVWPTTRISDAWRDGLDVLALTDHAGGRTHAEDLKPDLRRPFLIGRAPASDYGLLLIEGVEVAQGLTHCNALFVKDPNEVADADLMTALRKLKAQGACVFWNHPGWRRAPEWFPDVDAAHREGIIRGMELINDAEYYPEVLPWFEQKKLAVFCNSDVHGAMAPQTCADRRQITLVFAASYDTAAVREAIEARRTAAWRHGEVWGAEAHLRGLWEGAVRVTPTSVSIPAGARYTGLRWENVSAIPFRIQLRNAPAWLSGVSSDLPGQRTAWSRLEVSKGAPPGTHRVDLDLEITNFHTLAGTNLVVRLPVEIRIAR